MTAGLEIESMASPKVYAFRTCPFLRQVYDLRTYTCRSGVYDKRTEIPRIPWQQPKSVRLSVKTAASFPEFSAQIGSHVYAFRTDGPRPLYHRKHALSNEHLFYPCTISVHGAPLGVRTKP